MTTEQKAKAYNEALEWMRKVYPTLTGAAKEDAEHYFPELKESEDERIREWLIGTIKAVPNDSIEWDVIDKSCVLAYLEKQKAVKTPQWMIDFLNDILSSCIIYDDYVRRREYQSKVLGIIKWLENQKTKTPQWMIDFLKEIQPYSINKEEYAGYAGRIEFESKILTIIKWLEGNFIQQKEQKPSINIDQLKSMMLQYLQEAANEKDDSAIEADTDKWARTILRYDFEQKPVEWSEEDEEKRDDIVKIIEYSTTIPAYGKTGILKLSKEYKKELIDWLKSLRPQSKAQEQSNVDLEKEIEKAQEHYFDLKDKGFHLDSMDVSVIARNFYELGLNARKEK